MTDKVACALAAADVTGDSLARQDAANTLSSAESIFSDDPGAPGTTQQIQVGSWVVAPRTRMQVIRVFVVAVH